jgi:hypothetical protein
MWPAVEPIDMNNSLQSLHFNDLVLAWNNANLKY